MWNSTQNKVSEGEIAREHMRVLEEAVQDCLHYDIRTSEVYEALDYLQNKSIRSWGFTLFRQGLEIWSPTALKDGLKLIKQHLNV